MINDKRKGESASCVIALIHFIITFFTDHLVFEALPGEGVIKDIMALPYESRVHFIACKLALLVFLIIAWRIVFSLVSDAIRSMREGRLCHPGAGVPYRVAGYALLYFIPIIGVLVFKLPEGFLSNDETLIFAEASGLHTYTWFYYLTTYYYIITMMLIPSWLGPVLVKVALQVIACGYCVYRFRSFFREKASRGTGGTSAKAAWAGFLVYLPFFLFPVLAYTTSAHRIPVYYLIYLIMLVKLVMDRLENKAPGRLSGKALGLLFNPFFWLIFASALITQWRTEGIYMAPLSVILFSLAYPGMVGKYAAAGKTGGKEPEGSDAVKNAGGETRDGHAAVKNAGNETRDGHAAVKNIGNETGEGSDAAKSAVYRIIPVRLALLVLSCLLMQYAVQIPQNGALPNRMDDKAANRMGPFWAYTITNMYRNGLDLDKNAEDLENVYRYLDKDVLEAINKDLGDINYEDTLILYYPGYTGVIEGGDYDSYVEGCRNIFKNNPDVFLKTRWGAFKYAALPYRIGTDSDGIKGLIKLAFSVFKSLSYNLFIPCVLLVVMLILSLVKKRWLYFFIYGGLCCHWFIVFILAPASYFKYYLPVYMTVYFSLAAGLAFKIAGFKKRGA